LEGNVDGGRGREGGIWDLKEKRVRLSLVRDGSHDGMYLITKLKSDEWSVEAASKGCCEPAGCIDGKQKSDA